MSILGFDNGIDSKVVDSVQAREVYSLGLEGEDAIGLPRMKKMKELMRVAAEKSSFIGLWVVFGLVRLRIC